MAGEPGSESHEKQTVRDLNKLVMWHTWLPWLFAFLAVVILLDAGMIALYINVLNGQVRIDHITTVSNCWNGVLDQAVKGQKTQPQLLALAQRCVLLNR